MSTYFAIIYTFTANGSGGSRLTFADNVTNQQYPGLVTNITSINATTIEVTYDTDVEAAENLDLSTLFI